MWSRNGHELFFKALDNHIMVAAYTEKGDSFVADKPRVWSEKQIGGSIGVKNVDLAPDGKRIVALMPVETAERTESAEPSDLSRKLLRRGTAAHDDAS